MTDSTIERQTRETQHSAYLEQAQGLRDQLREHAAEADEKRRLNPDDVSAITDAGLTSLWAPAAYGGAETSVRTLVDATRVLGQGDAAAGWIVGVSNAATFVMSLFSEAAKQEIWADGSSVRSAGVLAPSGQSEVVSGGIRLTGRWPYMSGVTVADWTFVTAPLNGSLGPGAELGFVLVPRSDIEIDDTWFVTGMRATASATAVLEGVFVPEHRILRWSEYRPDSYSGIYRSHIYSILNICIVSTLVGEAEHALELVLDKAGSRSIVTTTYRTQTESAAFQVEVAKAAQLIESARLRLSSAAEMMDEIVAEGRPATNEQKIRNRADCSFVAQACWEALDTLASAHGTSTFSQSNPLERLWRNAAVGSRHAGLSMRVGNELLGRSLLGLDTQSVGPSL
ncbi:MAG: acyl-CoA dehydrogenase family protein [Actinomycetota bacterium]